MRSVEIRFEMVAVRRYLEHETASILTSRSSACPFLDQVRRRAAERMWKRTDTDGEKGRPEGMKDPRTEDARQLSMGADIEYAMGKSGSRRNAPPHHHHQLPTHRLVLHPSSSGIAARINMSCKSVLEASKTAQVV